MTGARCRRVGLGRLSVAALSAAALAFAGCGGDDGDSGGTTGGGGATASTGEQLFVDNCASCHTLAAAGTDGQVGPNLDELAPDKQRVLDAIATGPSAMPTDLVTGADAEAVATFVAQSTGQ